jgi:uncharacterized protein
LKSSISYDTKDVDNKTRISSVKRKQNTEEIKLDHPLLLAGFHDDGLIGSMSMSYLVEQLNMHQIAFVDSDFLMPAAVYVGHKLRHPFRLYANKTGGICCLICDTLISATGIRSVLDTIVKWTVSNNFKEIILLCGITSEHNSPDIINSNRKPLILSGDSDVEDVGYFEQLEKSEGLSKLALIGGPPGGLISSCLTNGVQFKAILIQTIKGIVDPEGVSILLEWLNKNLDSSFNVSVSPLKQKGKEIKLQLEKMMKSLENVRAEETEKERMYR